MKRFVMLTTLCLIIGGIFLAAPRRRPDMNFGDPVGSYSVVVEIDGVSAGRFTSISGLSIEQDVIEFQDGNDPLVRKRPGMVNYGDITLAKGYITSSILNDWIEEARLSGGEYTPKNISITLTLKTSQTSYETKRWNCHNCFPKSWKISSLDGKGNDVLTEELVIVIDYFEEA